MGAEFKPSERRLHEKTEAHATALWAMPSTPRRGSAGRPLTLNAALALALERDGLSS